MNKKNKTIKNLNPSVQDVMLALYDHYGRPEVDEDADDILATLIEALLSQATNRKNFTQAFDTLLSRYDADWEQIALAPTSDIQDAIKVGGLAEIKARRIQKMLLDTYNRYGCYSLEDLHDESPEDAYTILIKMEGIGPKTATFVLMRAANMPFFSMSTRILRICQRLGWGSETMSSQAAHDAVLPHIPDGEHDAFHTVLIEHGKALCTPKNPGCQGCPLKNCCAHVR